jgi:hypothetical protein
MSKSETMKLRLAPEEKKAFEQVSEMAGLSVSAWMRARLRQAAIREFEEAGRPIPFLRG